MKFFLILISVLFLGGCATGNRSSVVKSSSAPTEIIISMDKDGNFTPKKNEADKRNRALLAKAYDALKDGKQQEAIDKYLNPVIADFEKIYPGKSTIVYSARDQMEALL
ncbi:MAG: hypothetical protein GXP02_02580, partial [Alphaproteobacteria bacterium]|nr:hypothetical protein [Alphaproteobacteria bacterium]